MLPQPTPPLRLIFWETTSDCNLACIHCRRLDTAKQESKNDLSTIDALKLIDEIASLGKPILVLSGGEPLTRPDLFWLVKHAIFRGVRVALATNGTLITPYRAQKIAESGISRVAISIDGADASTHDQFRKQPGSLARALEGFHTLKALGMSMQINCTITQHNVHQTEELYQLALDLGADALHLFMLVPVGCGMTIRESNMLPAETYETILRWFFLKSLEQKMELKATCAPHYYRIVREECTERNLPLPLHDRGFSAHTKGCLAGTGVCFVSHTGEVFPCGYLPVSAGNVKQISFSTIWKEAPLFHNLRNSERLSGKCGICEYREACSGCRARAYSETGDPFAEEPYCNYLPKAISREKGSQAMFETVTRPSGHGVRLANERGRVPNEAGHAGDGECVENRACETFN